MSNSSLVAALRNMANSMIAVAEELEKENRESKDTADDTLLRGIEWRGMALAVLVRAREQEVKNEH